jgi:RNA polymerase sigma-70 factor (ECF subfamily)
MAADEDRFADVYRRYHDHVAAYCRRRSQAADYEDLVAEVFFTVWRKIEKAPPNGEVLPWLYRIAYLVLTNHWRSKNRSGRLQEKLRAVGITSTPALDDQLVMRRELQDVLAAAVRLRSRDQEILRLSLWEHLSHEEIGRVLDIQPNAAKQRLHRARKALITEHRRLSGASRNHQVSPAAQEGGEW